MGRALAAVAAALVFCFGVLGVVVYVSRDEGSVAIDNLLAERLSRDVARADETGRPLALADVADFPWDRVYVADPALSRDALSRALGFRFQGEQWFRTGDLLIFTLNGELQRFTDYRGEGEFRGLRRPIDSLRREDAVFDVEHLVLSPRR